MALPNSGAISSLAEDSPTLGVTFDLGHVLVLAWEEPREQALGSAHVQYVNNNYAVLHISHAVLPGCSLYDSVVTLVTGRNGSPCNHKN